MNIKSYHSICAWTFNSGKGGFTPPDTRPGWSSEQLDTIGKIQLIQNKIKPRLPEHIELGFEIHYDYEYNEQNASAIADAMVKSGISLAMATPGAHRHFPYGGIASPDPDERQMADTYAKQAVRLVYEKMNKTWHAEVPPTIVLWNGSYGYDLASVGIYHMYQNLKKSVAGLCAFEAEMGGHLPIAIEPKPNEGHPAMLLPTVASAIVFWKKVEQEFGVDLMNKGVNKEFGHSEMIGLDHVYDTVEEIDNKMLVHMHINSQGYNDGLILGGPGKYDIDHGARINGMNIAIAGLIKQAGYNGWKGHDMQVRAHDTEEQGIDRIIRSILSWDACEFAAETIDYDFLANCLKKRETAKAEDVMRHAVLKAHECFDEQYRKTN
ncbi:MAG: xylose isomerase [Deltaproteobacteria bacterium]|nr:xylose isomerase [Deltaproteobacteria bacterium]